MLSTCNRTEIYARCTHFHAAVSDVGEFLAAHSGADPDDFADHLYTYYDDAAVAHLFSVAAGLDSMIVGESEILGQVRNAWEAAVREGSAPNCCRNCSDTRSSPEARAHRDRDLPPSRVGSRCGRSRSQPKSSATSKARTVLVIGAGHMGPGWRRP